MVVLLAVETGVGVEASVGRDFVGQVGDERMLSHRPVKTTIGVTHGQLAECARDEHGAGISQGILVFFAGRVHVQTGRSAECQAAVGFS